MKSYTFRLEDGREVEVTKHGSYRGTDEHDWTVVCGDVCEDIDEACGEDVYGFVERTFDLMENQAHFVELVIVDVMGLGDITMAQAIEQQARWEAR